MRQQSYLVRKGARYHFRRRIGHPACVKPISISLGTADPSKARCLARRLAVKWDELDMGIEILGRRRTLSLDEQDALFRTGLKDELARATVHITAPIGIEEPHPLVHKMMATRAAGQHIRQSQFSMKFPGQFTVEINRGGSPSN
jgi:hypothetical protein